MDPRFPTPAEAERYLHERIPLSRALGASVVELGSSGARLAAPLEPNLNHRGTAFGGSLSALGILAGWTIAWALLRSEGEDARLVIRRHAIDFDAPAESALDAFAPAPDDAARERFLRGLRRRGAGGIELVSVLRSEDGGEVGRCEGRYAALRGGRGDRRL